MAQKGELGDTLHNLPLFIVGFSCEKRVNRILVDRELETNILLIHTMKELGISTTNQIKSRLMIRRFNQWVQRAIGAVEVYLTIEEFQSSVWLHVIYAKTSYKILLDRSWVYENKFIPSTYQHCLKYYEDEVAKKIIVDKNPFTEVETCFADVKFCLKKYATKIDDVASTDDDRMNKKSKIVVDKTKFVSKEDPKIDISDKTPNMNSVFSSKKVRLILCYVQKSKKDDGHSLNL